MKFSHISVLAIIFVVVAVSIAGCSSSSPASPTATTTSGAPSGATAAPASGSAMTAGSSASASDLFGGLSYNWIEYKMKGGSGSESMTMYIKYEKSGKCTMRFEGAPQGMPASMDCSSTGSKTQSNPNDASATPSSVKYIYVGPDVVTVPAGTFTADKYTVTNEGATSTFWIVKSKGMVKMVSGSGDGSATMELNGIG